MNHPARFARLAVVTLGLSSCAGLPGSPDPGSTQYAGKTIALGAAISLSGPGAVYGLQQERAIRLAVDTLNSRRIDGARISVDIQDDGSTPRLAGGIFSRMAADHTVVGLIGPTLSNSAPAAHSVAQQAAIPVVAVSTTGNGIVGSCPYPCTYIFRDSLGESRAIPANVQAAVDGHHPATAVLLYVRDDKFSSDGAAAFRQAFDDQGIQLLKEFPFSQTEASVSSYVAQAKAARPDLLAVAGVGQVPARVLVEARHQGFRGLVLGGNGFNTPTVARAAGAAGSGAQSASGYYVGNDDPANQTFVAAYRARYGQPPDQFAAQAYAGVMIFAEAAHHARLTFTDFAGDRTRLRQALATVKVDTPMGPFSFTSQHDVDQTLWVVVMDGAGGYRLVTSVPAD
ncbi:MAG: ABC transporter substrate-binding protein [Candidatus Dormibacteria bacterium]